MNPYGNDPSAWFRAELQKLRQEFDEKNNRMAGGLRRLTEEKSASLSQQLNDLSSIARSLQASRSGGLTSDSVTWYNAAGIARIEDIPGRRVPFDLTVDIPIGNNTTSLREGSITISQEGPFVAVKRYATFQSAFEFQVTQDGTSARFSGRSFGRYRPIHSAWDLGDGHADVVTTTSNPLVVGSNSAVFEAISNTSSFRTMEFDARIFVLNAGSSFPRNNDFVPSSFWTTEINSPQELGALDFFERGEVITFRVQPTHVNNPPAGNVDGSCIFGSAGWPFLEGQYDKQEGICTPGALSVTAGTDDTTVITTLPTDIIQRLPDGILTIGFLGYRIQQPVGPVQ